MVFKNTFFLPHKFAFVQLTYKLFHWHIADEDSQFVIMFTLPSV